MAMEAAAVENETLRRKLHNTMCELKGNIRVFCRVRPIKDSETIEGERDTVGTPRAMENDININININRGQERKSAAAIEGVRLSLVA